MNRDLDQFISTTQEIWRFIQNHNKAKNWMLKQGTPLQFFALRFLMQNPSSTVTDITKHFHITKSSVAQLMERLVKQGLIAKEIDKKDRRIVHLKLTKKATGIITKMRRERDEQMRKIFFKVSTNDLRELVRIHTSLLENLRKTNNV